MGASAAIAGGSVAGDQLARAHARLLHDPSLQFAFLQPRALRPPPGWLKLVGELIQALAPFMQWVFWGGLALAALAILVFIGREVIAVRWPGRKAKPPAAAAAADWRPEPAKARALLEDADRLAAQGLYAEAAHLLLHRSIDEVEGRRPRAVRPALTARDIAGLDSLPAAARGPFELIAGVVERSFFGGRPVDAASFAECRQAYQSFALPEAWG